MVDQDKKFQQYLAHFHYLAKCELLPAHAWGGMHQMLLDLHRPMSERLEERTCRRNKHSFTQMSRKFAARGSHICGCKVVFGHISLFSQLCAIAGVCLERREPNVAVASSTEVRTA